MNDYSVKEIRALATRAARGAYMPWGLAEEAGASMAWLERHCLPGVQPFVDLLIANSDKDPADLAPKFGHKKTGSGGNSCVCPVIAGAYLCDLRGTKLQAGAVEIPSVIAPILMLPFLVWVAQDLACSALVKWGRVSAHVGERGVVFVSGISELDNSGQQDVIISLTTEIPELSGETQVRVALSDKNQRVPEGFVQRTYLPESEQSKASGAGGGRVDDE